MSDSRVAGGLDRLPWLADEPLNKVAPARHRRRDVTGWAAAAVVTVAGLAFWLGSRSPVTEPPTASTRPGTTVVMPAPRVAAPEVPIAPPPQVAPAPQPEVRVIRVPEVRIVSVPAPTPAASDEAKTDSPKPAPAAETPNASEKLAPAATAAPAPRVAPAVPLRTWQPRVVAGAAGRLVEIGAFGSVPQAKLGWRHMVRSYPAVAHLPAVVRPDRNSKGRTFYRFRVGTTSQAHSEVLCQRMQKIHFSCAVVGLPWKAKVER